MHTLGQIIGLLPITERNALLPAAAAAIWLLFLPVAYLRRIGVYYNAAVWAAFWEEFVFRGVLLGGLLHTGFTAGKAVLITSAVFGLFHMRNVWWAGWRRSWQMTVYAGVFAGPALAVARLLTGTIYLSIFLHFLNNFLVIFAPGYSSAHAPRDKELRAASRK